MDVVLSRRETLSVLFKHWKLLACAFLATVVVFLGGSFLLAPAYKAQGQVLVQGGREFEIAVQKGETAPVGAPYVTKQEIINSEVEILNSRHLAEQTIRTAGLKRMYPGIAEDGDPPDQQMNDAVRRFSKQLKVEPVVMSNVITLSYWNADRDVALEVLSTFAQIYVRDHARIFGNEHTGLLGEEAGGYEKQLTQVTQKITELKDSRHLSDIPYEREQLIQDRSEVEAKLRDLKAQSIEAHRSLDYYQKRLKAMPELVLTNQSSADAVETAKSRLLDLQTQLLQLRQRYADGNSDAKAPEADLQSQIASIKSFIADPSLNQQDALGRNLTYDDARLKLQGAEASAPAIDQKILLEEGENRRITDRLKELDDGEASLELLAREQETMRELLHNSRSRYEDARLGTELDRQNAVSVSMIHPPTADLKTDKPKHVLYGAVGIVAGFMAMGVIALYLLLFRDTILTPESLERTLNLKVLGAVPDIA
jgi:uncharacterized protein involved in exopolysaccharide biosynthesis